MAQPIVVVEDDSGILPNARQALALTAERIEKYGYLKLENVIRGEYITVEENEHYRIRWMSDNFGGARAYAIAPWAAQKLLNGSRDWSLPVDNYIGDAFHHGMESYHISPYIVGDAAEFETTIQFYKKEKTAFYRKPSRELYSAYRKLKRYLHNKKIKKSLKAVG
jgi:glycosyl transferase family 25